MSTAATYDPLIAWQYLRSGKKALDDRSLAVVFRCADTKAPSAAFFGQSADSLIDISTWGHAVDSAVMASLDYALETSGAPLIVVLGHADCSAMHAAMQAWTEAALPDGAARTVVEQAIGSIVRRGTVVDSVAAVTSAHIVETGLSLLERSPVIARRVNDGQCAIICATVDPVDGKIVVHGTVGAVGEVDGTLLECV